MELTGPQLAAITFLVVVGFTAALAVIGVLIDRSAARRERDR